MGNPVWPVKGAKGKAWKVTSPFGWRIHPKTKVKKMHNGVDIWQGKEPTPLQACFDGKVVQVGTSTDPNSAGNKVVVQSTINGHKITWTYFHMVNKSIKVKVGQVVQAGDVVGLMGDTGFATGKHVHWEIWDGHRTVQPNINNGGKGFKDPMKFLAEQVAVIKAGMPAETPVTLVEPVSVPEPVVVAQVTSKAFVSLKKGSKGADVKKLQTALKITADGDFGPLTEKAVKEYQTKKGIVVTGVVDETTWKRLGL